MLFPSLILLLPFLAAPVAADISDHLPNFMHKKRAILTQSSTEISCIAAYKAKLPAKTSTVTGRGRTIGYYANWQFYSQPSGWQPFSVNEINNIDVVNYAFGTISYNVQLDSYYIDMTDPWADVGICANVGLANGQGCGGTSVDCIPIPSNKLCKDTSGQLNLALSPYAGHVNSDGSCLSKSTSGFNSGGSAGSRSTFPLLGVSNLRNTCGGSTYAACGQFNYLLNTVKQSNPKIQVVLSLGGWYDSNLFSPATSPKYRDGFIQSIVQFVNLFGWDGIDFDWEYPTYEHGGQPVYGSIPVGSADSYTSCLTAGSCQYSARANDVANYGAFLQALKAVFPAEKVISAAVSAGTVAATQLAATICPYMTTINVMDYDMHGTFDFPAVTAHQAGMKPMSDEGYSGSSADISVINGMFGSGGQRGWIGTNCPASKVVMGVPFYARAYAGVPDGGTRGFMQPFTGALISAGFTSLPNYGALVNDANYVFYNDANNYQAAYAYDCKNKVFATFDDPTSIGLKADWVNSNNLGGMMIWALGQDDSQDRLLLTIAAKMKKDLNALAAIPALSRAASTASCAIANTGSTTSTGSSCTSVYTIKSGDNCLAIATAGFLTVQQFQTLNPTMICNSLLVGQKVCLSTSVGTSSPSTLTMANYNSFTYLGCYVDAIGSRSLTVSQPSSTTMTQETCISACSLAGYTLAGLEYGQECYCGNSILPSLGLSTTDVSCNMPCAGKTGQACGGSNRLSVFQYTTGPIPFPGIGNYSYLGCMPDQVFNGDIYPRTLQFQQVIVGSITPQLCLSACQAGGYAYAGLEYATQCFCDSQTIIPVLPTNDTTCSMPCAGNSAYLCGGGNRLSVYYNPTFAPATSVVPLTSSSTMTRTTSIPSTTAQSSAAVSSSSVTSCSTSYTVKSGDTCSVIANTYLISTNQLYTMNSVINSACSNLAVGQVLCVQAAAVSSGISASSSVTSSSTASTQSSTSSSNPSSSSATTSSSSCASLSTESWCNNLVTSCTSSQGAASDPWSNSVCVAAAICAGPDRLLSRFKCLQYVVPAANTLKLSSAVLSGSVTSQSAIDLIYGALSKAGSSVYPASVSVIMNTYWSRVTVWTKFTSSSGVPVANVQDFLRYYVSTSTTGTVSVCNSLSSVDFVNSIVSACMSTDSASNPWSRSSCVTAAILVGPNNVLSQFACLGSTAKSQGSLSLDYSNVYAGIVGQCAWAIGGCSMTKQNFVDLVYSQLKSAQSTAWPSSTDILISQYWNPVTVWTGFNNGNVPFTNLQDWFRFYTASSLLTGNNAVLQGVATPTSSKAAQSTATLPATGSIETCDCLQSYTVVSGDTCAAIATKSGITLDELYDMNPDVNSGCTNLGVGQILCVD